ncbi:hypothetical protein V5P93_005547 [Actinokineospora auranticolor]|uniref:Uncharacterized protein n=1 Tax=Actinokineospora auranticolor TaxID=155976 RepID=A0A2S6GQM3_9PSEU|nr:hypothetical protein [Actinokineospora auranticolor]PPK67421.1 hypothetical protein CLV40_10784 [Actinokineospora auranticolor]
MTSANPTPQDWRRQLTEAFEVFLGGPLSDHAPDADYAVYLEGNLIHEVGFDRDPAWIRPSALSGAEPVVWDVPLFDDSDTPSTFDAARSIYEIHGVDPAAHPAFLADLAEVAFQDSLLRGADLAVLVDRHGIDLTDPAWADHWYVTYTRLTTDGTLFDAMRVALAIGDGPESLLDVDAEPEEEMAEQLEAVEHEGLRAHLGFFCTEGDEGMIFLGDEWAGGKFLVDEGCAPIAHWEEGQSQVELTVVRLSESVAGPRPVAEVG